MTAYFLLCVVFLTLAALAVAVYLVMALIQFKRTARAVQVVVEKLNQDMDVVHRVTGAAAGFAEALSGALGKTLAGVAALVFQMMRNKKSKASSRKAREADPIDAER